MTTRKSTPPPGAETIAGEVVERMERRGATPGQKAENISLYFGLGAAGLGVLVESLKQSGLIPGVACAEHWWQMVPWFNLSVLVICVLPKVLGRVTYGKVWEGVAARIGGKGASA